jgi:hypothetical protein
VLRLGDQLSIAETRLRHRLTRAQREPKKSNWRDAGAAGGNARSATGRKRSAKARQSPRLGLGDISTEAWSHPFVVAVDPVVANA